MSIIQYLSFKPLTFFAESLRTLRASLRHALPTPPRVIHVTSAVPGEGKSTIAATLAISAAASGLRTALVDLDVRNSSVGNLFELGPSIGVADVVQGNALVGSAMHPYRKLPLTVMAGGGPSLPDMIASPRLGQLIEELSSQFQLVVLDGPPVLAVADAVLIAGLADATVLVTEWRTTPRSLVSQAVKTLRSARGNLVGVVMNKVDHSKIRRTEGSSYGAYYNSKGDYVAG